MPRFKLRTLLIVLAMGPMVLAGSYWASQLRGRWLIHQGKIIYLPENTPGYHWALTARGGFREVSFDPTLPRD